MKVIEYGHDGNATVIREERRSLECPKCGEHIRLEYGTVKTITAPRQVAEMLHDMGFLEREELRVVLLTAKNAVRKVVTVYQGSLSAAIVRVGELFTEAVRMNAASIILVHNHPSGDPTPSPADLHLTAEAVAAGNLLDIPVLDHLVIGHESFLSLRDRGIQMGART